MPTPRWSFLSSAEYNPQTAVHWGSGVWPDGVFSEEDANAGDLQGVGTTFPKTYSHLSAFNPLNPIGSFWAATSATLLKQSAA